MCLQISDVLHLGFIGKQELFYSIFLNKDTECCKKSLVKHDTVKKSTHVLFPIKPELALLLHKIIITSEPMDW